MQPMALHGAPIEGCMEAKRPEGEEAPIWHRSPWEIFLPPKPLRDLGAMKISWAVLPHTVAPRSPGATLSRQLWANESNGAARLARTGNLPRPSLARALPQTHAVHQGGRGWAYAPNPGATTTATASRAHTATRLGRPREKAPCFRPRSTAIAEPSHTTRQRHPRRPPSAASNAARARNPISQPTSPTGKRKGNGMAAPRRDPPAAQQPKA